MPFGRRETCPHCQQAPCMGGKGPGSCMSGSKGKKVPVPTPGKDQDKDEPKKEHTSDWKKIGEAKTKVGHLDSFQCTRCGAMKVASHGEEPPEEVHKNRK